MEELIKEIKNFKNRFEKLKSVRWRADIKKKKQDIQSLEFEMSDPNFWKNRGVAENKSKKLGNLKSDLGKWANLEKSIKNVLELARLDKEDKSVSIRKEIEKELEIIKKELDNLEKFTFLNQKYDQDNAIFAIYAGAGGVDAQDWAEMLLRMYLRFCQQKGWTTRIIDQSRGGEAGIKSVTLEIEGQYAYGFLRGEAGVHRLVRISPFDAEQMRHTSFALVEVLPELEEVEVKINPDDLRIDTFLASGHGGQYVQKTESAVRIVHKPTKIAVTCQSERSQHQNKERAMKILRSKLYQYYQTKQTEKRVRLRGEHKSASWGNQIRSYVLHPYKMVKDHRTGYETSGVQKVLDGGLDEAIESYLKLKK